MTVATITFIPRTSPQRESDEHGPLAATTARLQRHWELEQHRRSPWGRWAESCPALALSPGEIRARLADRDRARSGPVLAALVDLARHGDEQAALLVTVALLPRMVRVEARSRETRVGGRGYDQLAGLLWEAVVTAPNSQVAALRESIERNVWRRKWRSERSLNAVTLDLDQLPQGDAAGDHAEATVAKRHVETMLDRLETDGAITSTTRRLLEQLAAGAADGDDRSSAAARKQRWRTVVRLRNAPTVVAALTA